MGVTITSDRIRLTAPGGAVKFDTNEELFTATNFVSGSMSLPTKSTSSNSLGGIPVNETNTYTLATGLNSNATTVLGLVRTNWSASGSGWAISGSTRTYPGTQVGGTRWRNANASIVDIALFHRCHHSEVGFVGVDFPSDPLYLQGISVYTLSVSGGVLSLEEEIQLQAFTPNVGGGTYTMVRGAGTLDYRVYCGLFV